MGDAGLSLAHARFSAERMVQDTLRVYERVALHPHVETLSAPSLAGLAATGLKGK